MKKKIAFVTGGYSGEAVISYESAKTIEAQVDRDQYDLFRIDIRPDGWFYNPAPGENILIDKNDFSFSQSGIKTTFDAVLCGIHGTPGEDGKLQGYFELIGLPYTACDVACSAITFNKRFTVAVAAFSGIPVSRSLHFYKDDVIHPEKVLKELKLPLFVKPNNGGSSIGMSKVTESRQLEVRSKKDFFDYEAKYTTGMAEEITPAPVEDNIAELIRTQAKKLYHLFNCKGVVRIDFIYNPEEHKAYMLEINTVPGQSANSLVPQQVKAAGTTLKAFYSTLIESCLKDK